MTILRCMDANYTEAGITYSIHSMWFYGSIVFCILFFALLLFGILPIIKYWKEFKSLGSLNISTRICFTVALFLKFITHCLTFIDFDKITDLKTERVIGCLLVSSPSYFITTCYTLVLLSWLMICMQILPFRIVAIFKKAKVSLIVYNVVIYILFIISIIIEVIIPEPPNETDKKLHMISGYFEIARDLFLFLLFTLFIVALRLGLGDDSFTETSIEQTKLFWLVIVLAVMMLLRGILSLIQVFLPQHSECGVPFFVAYAINEIIIEGVPLFVLLRINNGFLGSKRKMSFDLGATSLVTAD